MKKFLFTLCLLMAYATLHADTAVVDGITWTYQVSNGEAQIYKGSHSSAISSSTSGAITIPSTLGGYPVTSIGDYAFQNCHSLTSVTIPESVTSIGSYAFYYCEKLESITLPTLITVINERTFSWCTSLVSIEIPNKVTSIGNSAFDGCNSLTSITIPEGVTSIGDLAFWSCRSLTSITIPSSVTSIGEEAFNGCSSLTSVSIPESVTSIGERTFYACSSLTSVTIPESVTSIGDDAFYNCSGLTSVHISDIGTWCSISFGNTTSNPLSYATDGLYLNDEMITTAVIPDGVTQLSKRLFRYCKSLTSVTIPSSVTTIGAAAFEYCSGLTSVTIPEGVTTIGSWAFYGCSSLTSVTIPEGVTSIGDEAFYGCSCLTSVTIPEGVTEIGNYAFRGCSSLTSVTIPEGVTSIGSDAFHGCSSLTSVIIPASVTSIGNYAFYNCSGLQWVEFLGDVPDGFSNINVSRNKILFPREYGANWEAFFSTETRNTVVEAIASAKLSVSAEMTTPTTMKVTYMVTSDKETVKVRAVAFKDGVRSFANLVPVKTAAEGSPEAIPNGSAVTTNEAHTFVWNVPSDWEEDLAKVAMEILVQEGELLPQELITIPANGTRKAMTITRNTLRTSEAFNALLWCIIEGDSALTLNNGVVKVNGTQVANGTSLSSYSNQITVLLNYLYGRMGYKVLTGADLTYAEAATRLDLSTSDLTQVAVKIEEE